MAASQTLSRGIRMLEIVSESPTPLTIAQIAEKLDVHRSIAYRILRTLEEHRLLNRDDAGRIRAASGLAVLASGVQRDLQSSALPELTRIANDLQMTAFVALWEHDSCTTLVTVEPKHAPATVVQRPGTRHPLDQGAPGIAIQSLYSPEAWARLDVDAPYREAAILAAERGYAYSVDEVIPGLTSIAVPLQIPGQPPAAIAVVCATGSEHSPELVAAALTTAATEIRRELG